ncbi:LPS-assembly protein LptD [Brevundimonas aurifodinae]|uniref:LPS-assembly protein LptD n=2 Tax=Brevundimonas TaxID=41275 RepID=A0ABV1NNZ3_9CAUL|nr:MAG: organic solvent tolerance protein [Brevundimonas sp. 12-68-7]OYX34402.1 MAG: organic solvent tolerance protein [Brevundimonas subvibrioides]
MRSGGSVSGKSVLRARLLAGAAVLACLPAVAVAQTAPPRAPDIRPAPDGLAPDAIYIEADRAGRSGDVISATGESERVFARYQGNTLLGRSLTFDIGQGIGTADGEVELTDPEGNRVFASHLELDEDLRAGVAVDFATRLTNGASLMAATAVRRSENVNELNYAIFTPCPICDAEGNPKEPSLSIQAEKVVQDEELRAILYRNAVFKLGGVPVFWLPAFAHPDPTVERASGFLVPTVNYDDGRGLSLETPYLHVVSPSEDWLISPQFNTRVEPFLNLQWRRRFADGTIVLRGGGTYARNFGDFDLDGDGDAESNVDFGDRTSRSYFLGYGRFDPAGPWRWGFTAERTSDKTLFDRYDVQDRYQDNGLYYGDQRRLISQLYAERQTERSYLSVAAFSIQSLRVSRFDPVTPALNVFEDDDTLPLVAPLIDARWEPNTAVLGGRLRLRGSAVSLYRERYFGSPVLRPEVIPPGPTAGLPGVDSRRISGQLDWRRAFISPAGIRYEPFVDGRVDVYSVDDLPPILGLENETISRQRATVGLDVSYPLIRRLADGADLIVEPMGQLSLSTDPDLDPRIPNEDAETIELDGSSLFRVDRFPGHDLLEGGVRLTAGVRTTLRWGESRSASVFIGRSVRDAEQDGFRVPIPDDPTRLYDPTGLAAQTSDWVVQAEFEPSDRIRGWGHATIDGSGDLRRAETAVDGRWGRRNLATVSYILDRSNPLDGPLNRNYEFVQVAAQQFVYGNWGITVAGIADLERDLITRSEVGLLFDDDCFRIEVGYRRDNTRVRPTGPSDGVFFRLNLATFGGSGYGSNGLR